eukprot:1160412-Pelagomonas_calceolata.AAC.19
MPDCAPLLAGGVGTKTDLSSHWLCVPQLQILHSLQFYQQAGVLDMHETHCETNLDTAQGQDSTN